MGRNILIFSDGTGQAGGLLVDENRSNIYKLYRATRVGPDSTIDPAQQLAFYDPGLGSQSDNGQIKLGIARKLYNLVSQGTGLGITKNIIDCYAAILTLWRPGDRIFLIGFSRGAYTVRCVGGVLSMCGVRTQVKDGAKLRYDPDTIRAIAKEAVKEVYQYGASIKGDPFKELRTERARNFRKKYDSGDNTHANEYPHFIGVFDTVAALGVAPPVRRALGVAASLIGGGIAAFLAWLLSHWALSFWPWFAIWFGIPLLAFLAAYLKTHLRYHPVLKRFFLSDWSMKFYDNKLNRRVGFARHALSIDEARADFDRVEWVYDGDDRQRATDEPELLRQVWFAGDHSDIGGSNPENESRLSDNALHWMLAQLRELRDPLLVDDAVLRVYPSSDGPQHDECRKGFPGIWKRLGFKWKTKHRDIDHDGPLHPSVLGRFSAGAVLDYDVLAPYRPEPLRNHDQVKHYYAEAAAPVPGRAA
ncbi:MAG: DUF2235 domain-containing protein [Xanthobacteraceae bacterium]